METLTSWLEFIPAFIAFFASHMVLARPRVRACSEAALEAKRFTLIYSSFSLTVLIWLVGAAGRAPFVPLWTVATWQIPVAQLALLKACMLISLALGRPQSFSFGGSAETFKPQKPRLVRWISISS